MSNVAVVTIAGSTVTSRARVGSVRIEQTHGSPMRCTFTIDGTAPTVGQEIKIGLGSTATADLVFAGSIVSVEQSYEGRLTNQAWSVSCQDYTFLLNRRQPFKRYADTSATTIAQDLISLYASGFTSTNVEAALPSVTITFDGTRALGDCLSALAVAAGAYWYVDFSKDVHLFTSEASGNPDDLDSSNTTLQLSPALTYETDLSQVRTRVYAAGPSSAARNATAPGVGILPLTSGLAPLSAGNARVGGQFISYTGAVMGSLEPTTTPTGSVSSSSGGSLTLNADYQYAFTWKLSNGDESALSPASNTFQCTNASFKVGKISGIPALPPCVSDVNIYRTKANAPGTFYLAGAAIALFGANRAGVHVTGVSDPLADGSLGAAYAGIVAAVTETETSSTSTSNALTGATSIPVADIAKFSQTGGVLVVNGQFLTYTGCFAYTGASSITGIPASGTGSITSTILSGSTITNVAALTGVPTSGIGSIEDSVFPNDAVLLVVQRDDTSAQTALAAIDGTDGIVEHMLSGSYASIADAEAAADADLGAMSSAKVSLRYTTRDTQTRVGKTVVANLTSPTSIAGTFTILRVTIDQLDLCDGRMAPRYSVEASTVQLLTFERFIAQLAQRQLGT